MKPLAVALGLALAFANVVACSKPNAQVGDGGADAHAPTLRDATATTTTTTTRFNDEQPRPVATSVPSVLSLPSVSRDAAVLPVSAWIWKAHHGDGFTIAMPGEPKVTVLSPDDDRVGFTEAKVDVPGGQVSFMAGFSDYPAEAISKPDAFLDDHVAAPRRGLTDVLTKRPITLATGEPGRVLILRRNISGTPLRVYSRIYLVKRRLYSLIVSTLDEGGVGEDVVKRFMDSFRLAN